MLYAKIVVGLPVKGPFDYIIPEDFSKKVKVGTRVWINFRNQKILGYLVKITKKSSIKNLKPIIEAIDDSPIIDKNMLQLTRELSDYYACSWGQAIETALPQDLRRGKKIQNLNARTIIKSNAKTKSAAILVHHIYEKGRWEIYFGHIKQALRNSGSVIILLPDRKSVLKMCEEISNNLQIQPTVLYRSQTRQLEEWLKAKRGEAKIVLGTRSGIFAPATNLSLIIIDQEQDSAYKQDQVPHYNVREVALMRSNIENTKLILGSSLPSLESFYLTKRRKIKYVPNNQKEWLPEVKIIDMKNVLQFVKYKSSVVSKYLEDAIISALNTKGKILLFVNRKGFATFVYCRHCGAVMKCQRCNVNLAYHFKKNVLTCHYCNFETQAPAICPNCNSGYIKFSGVGTEKIESELSRIFPQAKIKRLDDHEGNSITDTDIIVSAKAVIKQVDLKFELIGVLSIDNSLNRVDFRASEKTFDLLVGLLKLTRQKIVVQTNLPQHHCFQALEKKDPHIFYNEELRYRKQLNFPPYRNICLIKLRGVKDEKVRELSYNLFKRLIKYNRNKNIDIVSVAPGQPSKLRGKFCWQIFIKCDNVVLANKFIKRHLKEFSRSGAIVTIDVDPI